MWGAIMRWADAVQERQFNPQPRALFEIDPMSARGLMRKGHDRGAKGAVGRGRLAGQDLDDPR